jgi:polysaccharide export outer membrane protein
MTRSICSYAGLLLIALCLSGTLLAQTKVQPATPTGPATVIPGSASASDSDKAAAAESPTGKVHQDHTIRIGTGDLLQITVYGAPDLTTEARVNDAGNITMALIGSVYLAGLTSDQAQQLIATRLRDGGLLRDPQVAVFEKQYASQGIAVMGEVQKPGIYTLFGERRLYDAISAAGGTTARAGRAVTITHPVEPNKPLIVDMDFMDPSRSPAGNVEVSPGDTVVVSRAGVVYVVGAVARPAGFVMENNGNLTVLQAVALAGGTERTASLSGAKILRQTSNGVQEIPIPLNKILAAKAQDTPMQAEDVLFVPTSTGKRAAITGAQTALALVTGLAIYGKF